MGINVPLRKLIVSQVNVTYFTHMSQNETRKSWKTKHMQKINMHLPPFSRFCHNQDVSQFSAHLTVSVSQFFVT